MTTPKTKRPPSRPLTMAEKIANHLPAGLTVEPAADGKIRVQLNTTKAPDRFRRAGGCTSEFANLMVLNQVLKALPQTGDLAQAAVQATGAVYMMASFAPKDAVEAMIASQAVALHAMTMETARRAQLPNQPVEVASKLRKDAANLARAMTDMCEALDRRRGKGPQVVRVERVVVHEGAQAIVGNVQAGAQPALGQAPAPLALAAEPVLNNTGGGE